MVVSNLLENATQACGRLTGGSNPYLRFTCNTNYPEGTRTFAVITTGEKTTAGLYKYEEDGSVTDIAASVSKEQR